MSPQPALYFYWGCNRRCVKITYSLCGTKRKTADLRHLGPLTPLGSFRPKEAAQKSPGVVLVILGGLYQLDRKPED